MNNKSVFAVAVLFLASSAAMAGSDTLDAAIGGAVGGAVGAAVGNEVGGRDGAIIGGAIGGAAGAAIATDSDGRSHSHSSHNVRVESRPARSLPPGLAKKGKVPPGHAR